METAIALLSHYGFDLGGYTAKDLTRAWSTFHPEWVRKAVIEALFQGRYKAVSVNQLLNFWERKGKIICHHNRDFERLICGDCSITYSEPIHPKVISEPAKPILEISPFVPQETIPPISLRAAPEIAPNYQNNWRYQRSKMEPSGTTAPVRLSPNKAPIPDSQVYRSAYENMTLLAESSMFVDKLRSICIPKNTPMAEEMSPNEPQTAKAKLF